MPWGCYTILNVLSHSSVHLPLSPTGGTKTTSHNVFAELLDAMKAAQRLILSEKGTLTTLVGCVITPSAAGGHAMMSIIIGDSPGYVWRAADGIVQEVTHAAMEGSVHRCAAWPGTLLRFGC